MDYIPKDKILETKQDSLKAIRKEYGLDKPGQMKEAINILRDWVQKQNHFKKKDFNNHYYELSIIVCKGSLERAKTQIDKMCTMRTLLPQFFGNYNVKKDFSNLHDIIYSIVLPKTTNDYYRVLILKVKNTLLKPSIIIDLYRFVIYIAEYIKAHDYMNGFILTLDYSEANLGDIVSNLNAVEFRQIMSILIEGFGMRLQAIRIISSSKFINALILLLKQVVSAKVAGRIHVHKTVEEIHEHIPKSILPKDYGGEERSLKELQTEWIEALSSEEHTKYMQEINEAGTDETYRQKDKFNEQYAGMPGTFRLLSVD